MENVKCPWCWGEQIESQQIRRPLGQVLSEEFLLMPILALSVICIGLGVYLDIMEFGMWSYLLIGGGIFIFLLFVAYLWALVWPGKHDENLVQCVNCGYKWDLRKTEEEIRKREFAQKCYEASQEAFK